MVKRSKSPKVSVKPKSLIIDKKYNYSIENVYKDPHVVLDGIEFHSKEELTQYPTFLKIKELLNNKDNDTQDNIVDELRITKPQLFEYILNNLIDISNYNNTELNDIHEVDIGNVPNFNENKNSKDIQQENEV
jgi:hypothetical protein